MPRRAFWLALFSILTGALLTWTSGCSDLEEDCELLVNCPETKPPPECSGLLYPPTCSDCLQTNCCQEASDCLDNNACGTYCMYGIMPPAPDCIAGQTGDRFTKLTTCLQTKCSAQCGSSSSCNPVSHTICPADGTQCELVYPGVFTCVPPAPGGTPAQLCQPCNFDLGPYCGSGLRCHLASLQCARYCCSDLDCGTGRCELNQNAAFGYSTLNPLDMVGLCLAMEPGIGPSCDAPAPPPLSGGTCIASSPGPL